jgi:peptide/nickel transport system substrate-binding protein
MKQRFLFLVGMVTILAMILGACTSRKSPTPAATAALEPTQPPASELTEPPAAEPTTAPPPEPTKVPTAEDYVKAARNETVIFDTFGGGRVTSPDLWNPYVPGSRLDQGYYQAILEPLFILNIQTGEFMPWIGESMAANATLDEWTLKLHRGVKWSDGQPFTADDVVFSVQTLMDHAPDLNGSAAMKDWVKSVEKVDDLTVKFTLNRPNPRFQLNYFSDGIWGGINIVPKHIWEGQDPLTFKNYDPAKGWPVGTGAYKLAGISPTEFQYIRNDAWWGAKTGLKPLPAPKKLVWTSSGPEANRTALMANKQLDSLMGITYGAWQALRAKNPNIITWLKELPYAWVPDPCSRTFEFNTAVAPWDDPEMRWAINHLINRNDIVEIAYQGTTVASKHFFPQYPPLDRYVKLLEDKGLFGRYPIWSYDPAEFKQIVESKGWVMGSDGYYAKDGKQLAMTITTNETFTEEQGIAQHLVEVFRANGINATHRNEAGSAWDENFNMGKFEARIGWQTCGSVNEPWNSMDTFNTRWFKTVGQPASRDQWRWSGPDADAYSALVDEIGALPLGDPKIDDLFLQAMDFWIKNLPVIPVTQGRQIIPFDTTYWTGWPTGDNPYIQPPTWWQSAHCVINNLKPAGAP